MEQLKNDLLKIIHANNMAWVSELKRAVELGDSVDLTRVIPVISKGINADYGQAWDEFLVRHPDLRKRKGWK